MGAPAERWATAADGARLHVLVWGEAGGRLPVVCLPGLLSPNRVYEEVAPLLAGDGRLVAAVSLRGRGRSDRDPTGASYALDRYAEDVVAVLDELGVDRAVLLGTSLGGLTAMWAGWRRSERVAAVVLNDVGPDLQDDGYTRIRALVRAQGPVASWDEAVAVARAESGAQFPTFTDDDWARAVRQRWRERDDGTVEPDHDPAAGRGRLSEVDPWLVFASLADRPLLLVRGALTDVLAPETVAQMQAFHPTMTVVEVPDRGHSPTLTEPVVLAALQTFLATVG